MPKEQKRREKNEEASQVLTIYPNYSHSSGSKLELRQPYTIQPGENLRACEFTTTETERTKNVDTNNVPVPNSKRGRDIEAFGFIPNKHNIDSRVAMERDGIV